MENEAFAPLRSSPPLFLMFSRKCHDVFKMCFYNQV